MGLDEMDASLLLGQVFAMRLPSDPGRLDPERFPVANYIVFKDALKASLEETRAHLDVAERRLRQHGIEPLFMMDEEGGRVTQVSRFFPSAPSPRAVSHHLEPAEAGELYRHMSEVLARIGIDINLAPCMDVNTEPMNPIIGCRAFGTDRPVVEHYGTTFIEASRQHLACVAKHFPGHGMTKVDSHLDMPVVHTPREDLETIHIPPFVSAIRAGADGIMIDHCRYTAVQGETEPASFSKAVVRDLLRRDIGFDGLVITDSLDMDAVTHSRSAAEASRQALDAGADILLYTEGSPRFEEAFETLSADLVAGRLERHRLMESVSRRHHLLDRITFGRLPKESVPHKRYLELRSRVIRASVRTDDPKGNLPLEDTDVACVTTDRGLLENTAVCSESLREIESAEDTRGSSLLLWLVEPLRLKHSLEAMRSMVEAAKVSVLVTSYVALADTLDTCDVKIVVEDTSPETRSAILRLVFG